MVCAVHYQVHGSSQNEHPQSHSGETLSGCLTVTCVTEGMHPSLLEDLP